MTDSYYEDYLRGHLLRPKDEPEKKRPVASMTQRVQPEVSVNPQSLDQAQLDELSRMFGAVLVECLALSDSPRPKETGKRNRLFTRSRADELDKRTNCAGERITVLGLTQSLGKRFTEHQLQPVQLIELGNGKPERYLVASIGELQGEKTVVISMCDIGEPSRTEKVKSQPFPCVEQIFQTYFDQVTLGESFKSAMNEDISRLQDQGFTTVGSQ